MGIGGWAVWHNCMNGRASFARRRQTEAFKTSPFYMELLQGIIFHLELLRACLNLLHPTGKAENLVIHRPFFDTNTRAPKKLTK